MALAVGLVDAAAPLQPFDLGVLTDAGRALTGGDLVGGYSDPRVQVGPLQLLLLGALARASDAVGLDLRLVFSGAVHVGLVVGSMLVFQSLRKEGVSPSHKQELVEVGVGATVLGGGLAWTAYINGHPEEALIGLLWVLAGHAARGGKSVAAGLLVAVAGGLKLWGWLGLPLLLLGRRREVIVPASLVTAAAATLLYGPFLLWGGVQTFAYRWPIDSPLLRVLLGDGTLFDWRMRLVQGAFVLVLGSALVWRFRGQPALVWGAPIAIVLLRILSDPLPHHYFWLPIAVAGLMGLASYVLAGVGWSALAIAALFYGALLGAYLPVTASFVLHVAFAAVMVILSLTRGGETAPLPS